MLSDVVQPCPAPAFRKMTEWLAVEAGSLSQAFFLSFGYCSSQGSVPDCVRLYLTKEVRSSVSTWWLSWVDSSTKSNSWSLVPWTLRTFIELKSLGFVCILTKLAHFSYCCIESHVGLWSNSMWAVRLQGVVVRRKHEHCQSRICERNRFYCKTSCRHVGSHF